MTSPGAPRRSRAPRAPARPLLATLLLALFFAACGDDGGQPGSAAGGSPISFGERTLALDLYFPGPGGLLVAQPREIAVPDEPEPQIRAVVEALLAGPGEGEGAEPVFPAAAGEIVVAAVYLSPDGEAVLDLRPAEGDWEPVAGSHQELLMVYSLVNTVSLNVPAARRVALLWNGLQRPTFAGHIDTTRALAPAPDMVAR